MEIVAVRDGPAPPDGVVDHAAVGVSITINMSRTDAFLLKVAFGGMNEMTMARTIAAARSVASNEDACVQAGHFTYLMYHACNRLYEDMLSRTKQPERQS